MKKHNALIMTTLLASVGCGGDFEAEFNRIIGSDYDLPVTATSPAMDLDVGEQVIRMEDEINARKDDGDDERQTYEILLALCQSEPGRNCSPARFPSRIPRYMWPYGCIVEENGMPTFKEADLCVMEMSCQETPLSEVENGINPMMPPSGNGCIDVKKWIEQIPNLQEYLTVAGATKYDLSDKIDLSDSTRVKKVNVDRVVFHFSENTITYPIPDLTTYVGDVVTEAETQDAKKLIRDGAVVKFGTLPETSAMFNGAKAMQVDADGKAVLSDKLKGFSATIAEQAIFNFPGETDAARLDNCKDPAHLPSNATEYCESFPKPDGKTKFAVEMTVTFTVNAAGR